MPQVGTVIADRYLLRERIAAGSTGETWRASDIRLDRVVVVKLLAEDIEAPPRTTPLVTVYDRGSEDGRDWVAMEYPSGGSLRELLDARGRLPEPEAMDLIAKAALALQAAHTAGVVHRDLRPGHILLRTDGSVAIIDAGLAPGWWSAAEEERWGKRAPYLAPEQVRGAPVTAATDVYALGVVAYECLTGWVPFLSGGPAATAVLAAQAEAPPLPPQISPAAQQVVRSALAKDPAARWASAAAMAAAAQAATAHPAPAASPDAASVFRAPTVPLPTVRPIEQVPTVPTGPATVEATAPPVVDPARRARLVYVLVAAAVAVLLLAVAFLVPERNGVADRTGPGGSRNTHAVDDAGHVVAIPGQAAPSATVSPTPAPPPPATTRTTTSAPAPPPAPPTYMVPVGTMTPQYKDGTCVYRVQFGNVSSTGYAKVRFYQGSCGGTTIEVAALRTGLVLTWEAAKGQEITVASDSCGSSYEEQATSNAEPAYGVGARITFGETGHVVVFMDGNGKTPPVVRTC